MALGLLVLTLLAGGAEGQTERHLELHVIDSLSGAPVENAEIRVIKTVKDTAGWMVRRSTDTTGRALLAVPGNEHLLMLVRRLGYSSSLVQITAAIAARKPLDIIAVVGPYIKNACTMAYLDGLPLVDVRDIDVRRVVGVEYYPSNLEAPAQFPNQLDSEHRCATILIWRQSP
jgi:hypothetical protein